MSFFSELKRRNVFRAGATYAVLAWVLMQVADIVLPTFSAPEWVLRVFLFFLILAFPLVLLVSWVYELTPEGFKRTTDVDPTLSIRSETGAKLNYITIGSVVLLLLVTLVDRNLSEDEVAASATPIADTRSAIPAQLEPTVTITDKSIAVLPLDDFNAGGEEEYFADGLTEEILNALTRTPDLLVASRTSSFQYKDQAVDIQNVAQELGVAHVLEGSVRRSAERLRVTVQLIRASDGFHLWSENYDRTPDDIIAVQEDIAFQIATALQTAMNPAALQEMVKAGTRSVAAYNAYLKAVALSAAVGELGGSPEMYEAFELARELDPEFSRAHAGAAYYWRNQSRPNIIRIEATTIETIPVQEMVALHDARMQRAIATATGPERLLYQMQQASVNLQFRAAFGYLQQYLESRPASRSIEPGLTGYLDSLIQATVLGGQPEVGLQFLQQLLEPVQDSAFASRIVNEFFYLGAFAEGRNFALEALARFPFSEEVQYQVHRLLISDGYIEEAHQVLERVTGTQLPTTSIQLMRLRQACAELDYATANQLATALMNIDQMGDWQWQVLHLMSRTQEAADSLRPLDQDGSLFSLSSYLMYPYFDIDQYPNLKAVLERDGVTLPVYQSIPYACPVPANE